MIDFEDMLGLGFEEEPEIVDSYEAQPDCETSGGWGSFLLGGVVGALWSGSGKNKSNDYRHQTYSFDSFSDKERIFLRQIWRWEEEFDKARADDDVERIILLLNGLVGCIDGPWKPHLPGDDEYFATDKFDTEFEYLALPILNKATEVSEAELSDRLTPEQFERIDGRQMSLNPDDWSFTMN
jgi:hypothetical protein